MNASVTWQDGLTFTGTADTGFTVPLGAHPKVGGADDGLRPLELMAMSLAGCTGMDVISILLKKRLEITAFEVKVHAQRADQHPRVFTSAVVEYEITGHGVKESAVTRAIELSARIYCPAQAMLAKLFPIQLHYTIYEGEGKGERELVTRGQWTSEALEPATAG